MTVYRLSTQPDGMPRINLLLIEKAGKFHYTWIKNLNRLLYDQSKHKERKHFCERCLHGYTRKDLLEAHRPDCRGIGQTAVRVEMPEKGKNKVFFQNHHKQLPVPFIIYADSEALTTKVRGPSSTPQRATLRRHNTMRLVVIATSWCGVMVRQMQVIWKVERRVSCIPNNTEKYISFSLGQLRFIDSAQFVLASLDKLVAANPPGAFQITAKHEPNRERWELLMRKGVYPYEYMDIWDRCTEPKLPPPPQWKPSTANSPMRISVTRTTRMRKRSGRPLGARPWETTATCTVAPTSCFWQMSLRRSGRCASVSSA